MLTYGALAPVMAKKNVVACGCAQDHGYEFCDWDLLDAAFAPDRAAPSPEPKLGNTLEPRARNLLRLYCRRRYVGERVPG